MLQLKNKGAEIYVPDGQPLPEALKRTTHLAVSAHQDDIEIMASGGILACYGQEDKWFTGIVVTNGSGSPRDGLYATCTDEEMQKIRKKEQKKAAFIGEYAAQVFMDYPSSEVKDPANKEVVEELAEIIRIAAPEVLYLHNLADKHNTHVATAIKTLQAVRMLPPENRPEKVYGCEVWRDLDWLPDEDKVRFDLSAHENLSAALLGVYDSQICGGKRYDLAVLGRRRANATFSETHKTDITTALSYAMDLTPLVKDDNLDIKEYVLGYINRLAQQVKETMEMFLQD